MVSYLCAGLLALIVVGKVVASGRRPLTPTMRHLLCFFLCFGGGIALGATPTNRLFQHFEPMPLTARLLANGLELLAMYFLMRLARSTQTPEPRSRLWHFGLVWLALGVLLFLATRDYTHGELADPVREAEFHLQATAVAYQVVLVGYAIGCLAEFGRMIGRHAATCPPGSFRTGLKVIVLSSRVTLLWGVIACLPTVWVLLGASRAEFDLVNRGGALVVVVLWVSGAVVTTWSGLVERPRLLLAAHRGCRAVTPLWSALVAALPGIALAPVVALPHRVEFALYRRLIEIRDGSLALRGHVPPEVALWVHESARAHSVPDLAPVLEAASLAAALIARAGGHSWPPTPGQAAGIASIEAETAWLTAVSAAFTGSPVVAEVRRRARLAYAGVAA
ncbi:hypothetical protein JOF53_005594 [Crossiella equi]|uniref:DUF6545 domain-containing protein n=1 Tax=Crossiella equi TaxID=130796 RepID=A0ABS5AJH2_9PSEU|nr:MAB_1171c family putative transporter [Crossiella equi]MBP2476722.1 hypothetical protein [Crossiella equi]